MNSLRRGFTLVEIMVVIAVISILATVTVVAYRGVSSRSAATSYGSAADQIEKLLTVNYARTQGFPALLDSDDPYGNVHQSCFVKNADSLPATADFPKGVCVVTEVPGEAPAYVSYNPALMDLFPDSLRQDLPDQPLPLGTYEYKKPSEAKIRSRGIVYSGGLLTNYCDGHGGTCSLEERIELYWISPRREDCGKGSDPIRSGREGEGLQNAIRIYTEVLEEEDLSEEERASIQEVLDYYIALAESPESYCLRVWTPKKDNSQRR